MNKDGQTEKWQSKAFLSSTSNDKSGQNFQKQPFQDSGN